MSEIFSNIPVIKYEGAKSTNPFAFKFYDPERIVLGKKMSEHLPFAMAWWHNLCAAGTDMFGRDTADKSFGAEKLAENYQALMDAIVKAKPAAAKGTYLKSIAVASTMGPSVRVSYKQA